MVKKFAYILSFLEIFSFGLLLPVLGPQIIAIGGNRFILGLLGSLQCFLQFFAGPIFGSWSDNVGAKPALLLSAYGLLAGQLIFSIPHLYCYIIGRVITSCFAHGQILVKTLLAEAKVMDQAGVEGTMRVLGAISFTFAPIIGGYIMGQDDGFYKLSIFCTSLTIIYVTVCHLIPTRPATIKKSSEDSSTSNIKQIVDNLHQVDWSTFGSLFTVRFLVETAAAIYHQSLGFVFAVVFKSTPQEVGIIISFYGVCSIIVNMKMATLRRYIKDGNKWGTIGILLSFGVIYLLPYFWIYIAFIVSFGIFKTLLDATWTDNIIEMASERNKGAVNGVFQSLVQLAGFIAPLMNAYISEVYGHSTTIATCSVIGALAVVVSSRIKRKVQ